MEFKFWTDQLDPQVSIGVDGGMPCKLHISHWPGNRTPEALKADMSTAMCLKLNASPERETLLDGITTVTNDHYDTDGILSVFTILHSELAAENAQLMLEAAVAGDFGAFTTRQGTAIDLTLTALTKHPESPVHSDNFEEDVVRRQSQHEAALELVPKLLKDPFLYMGWIQPELSRIESDLRSYREEDIDVEKLPALELAVIRAEKIHRRAANTIVGCDRILTLTEKETSFRLTTRSWFELVSIPCIPRPPLSLLAQKLTVATGVNWVAGVDTLPLPEVLPEGQVEHNLVRTVVTEFLASYPVLPVGL